MKGQRRGGIESSTEYQQWVTLTLQFLADYELHAIKGLEAARACIAINPLPQFQEQKEYWRRIISAIKWLRHQAPLWAVTHVTLGDADGERSTGPGVVSILQLGTEIDRQRNTDQSSVQPPESGEPLA